MAFCRRSPASIRLLTTQLAGGMRFDDKRSKAAQTPQNVFSLQESECGFVNKSYRKKRSRKKHKILAETEEKR